MEEPPVVQIEVAEERAVEAAEPHLPTETKPDGTLVIDLKPLAPDQTECIQPEPDPFNPEIIVCRKTALSPRIGPEPLPETDDFGNAIPRARLRLSENAEIEANALNQGVGGFNANGGEVRLKIDF